MNEQENTWPPPPEISPSEPRTPRVYGRVEIAVRLLICYTFLWTSLFITAQAILIYRNALIWWLFFYWPFDFAGQMLIVLCLHLPIVPLLQRFLQPKDRNLLALASASWGGVLAVLQWYFNNYAAEGYNPSCSVGDGLMGNLCGIPHLEIVSLLFAGSIGGYAVGRILMRQNAHEPAA